MNRIFLQESLIYLLFIYLCVCVCVVGNDTSVCVHAQSFGAQDIFKRCHSSVGRRQHRLGHSGRDLDGEVSCMSECGKMDSGSNWFFSCIFWGGFYLKGLPIDWSDSSPHSRETRTCVL